MTSVTNNVSEINEDSQKKINQIRVNEAKYQSWYDFMDKDQLSILRIQMNESINILDSRQKEIKTKKDQLQIQLTEFTRLDKNAADKIAYFQHEIETQGSQKLSKQQEIADQNMLLDNCQVQINKLSEVKSDLSKQYLVSQFLVNNEKLDDPILNRYFTCLNYVIFDDQTTFDWTAFQSKSFYIKTLEKDQAAKPGWQDMICVRMSGFQYMALKQNKLEFIKDFLKSLPPQQGTITTLHTMFKIPTLLQWLQNLVDGNIQETLKQQIETEVKKLNQELSSLDDEIKSSNQSEIQTLWEQQQEYNKKLLDKTVILITQLDNLLPIYTQERQKILTQALEFDELLLVFKGKVELDAKYLNK